MLEKRALSKSSRRICDRCSSSSRPPPGPPRGGGRSKGCAIRPKSGLPDVDATEVGGVATRELW